VPHTAEGALSVETHWSERGHPGTASGVWSRLCALALGTPETPRPDGLDLTVTNPERLGLVSPLAREIVARAAQRPYVPDASGSRAAREAIAESYIGRSKVSPEDVLLTASTSESYSFVLHALCDPGEAVLVPRPSYPLLPDLARLADVHLRPYDIRYAGHFQLDPATMPSRAEIAEQRVRAAIVVSPNNPTGHVTSRDELELLSSLGLPLIVDEVFRPFVHKARASFADPLASGAPTFLLDGLSKRAGLPGLKAGWIVLSGDEAFRCEARRRLESIADTFLSVSAAAQAALPELLKHETDLASGLRARVSANLLSLRAAVRGTKLTLIEPEAGWSVILRLPALRSEETYFEELASLGVWTHPGGLYDLPMTPCFVLSLLCPPMQLSAGVLRLLELLDDASIKEGLAPPPSGDG
jgi:alanine-synthesizing transaminase